MPQAAALELSPGGFHRAGAPTEWAGRLLRGTYRIVRQLDAGGMSRVFEAEHLRLHRRVAVKVLPPDLPRSPEMCERFVQEAEMVSRLEHPHIVTVHDFDVTEDGELYLVLELLHGETLADRLAKQAPLPADEAVQITMQIASGLIAAHRASIVHRDLKPGNIFLTGDAGDPVFAKLLDFGISRFLSSHRRITRALTLVGTPDYMAPEQALGRSDLVDARTDEYALAVVFYEMLTGNQPFAHGDLSAVLDRVLHLELPPVSTVAPWVPRSVDAVVSRALEKSPMARFADVAEFSAALATAMGAGVKGSTPPSMRAKGEAPPTLSLHAFTEHETARTWPSAGTSAAAERVLQSLERTRAALHAGALLPAIRTACVAFDLAERSRDPVATTVLKHSEPLLTHVFMRCLGSPARRLQPKEISSCQGLESSREVFLLSRLEPGMSIEEAVDVSAMPRLEALRHLVQLVTSGTVLLE